MKAVGERTGEGRRAFTPSCRADPGEKRGGRKGRRGGEEKKEETGKEKERRREGGRKKRGEESREERKLDRSRSENIPARLTQNL